LRFLKSFSNHLPLCTKDAYVKQIMAADLDKLASLIRICGFLMQTKAYLFWQNAGFAGRELDFILNPSVY